MNQVILTQNAKMATDSKNVTQGTIEETCTLSMKKAFRLGTVATI